MKIKTITCHDVYNYGASLQAYALQTFLEKQGNEVEIIDYLPIYKPKRYDWFHIPEGSHLHFLSHIPIFSSLAGLICHRKNIMFINRYLCFKRFKQNYLHCTNKQYHNIDELRKDPPLADLFIAGSDQIWNTKYINGTDSSFYLDFVKNPSKCISYAASFATSQLDSQWQTFVKKMLANFKAISVREKSGVDIVDKLGYEATEVLDPVFLLERKNWDEICHKKRKGHYLLLYDFLHNDPRIKTACKQIATQKGLKIYSLNDGSCINWVDHNICNAGPIEFIEWIRNADFVVSTSFHATAFSVIFQKEFLTYPLLGHNNSSRMLDFLKGLNIADRFVDAEQYNISSKINYYDVDKILEKKRKYSRQWLVENLQ